MDSPATAYYEPVDDPADRYEGAVDRLVGKLICPKCAQSWGREHFGEINCDGPVPMLAVACPCGVTASIPIL